MIPIKDRARALLDNMDPAIEGRGGNNQTFAACMALVDFFGLDHADSWELLKEYNERCVPPWEDKDLDRKLRSAEQKVKDNGGPTRKALGGSGKGANGGGDDYSRVVPVRRYSPYEHLTGAEHFKEYGQNIFDGIYKVLDTPWDSLNYMNIFLPGKVTILASKPEAGKSFLVLNLLIHLIKKQRKVLYVPLEEDMEHYLKRTIAILANKSWLTDIKRSKDNQDELVQEWKNHSEMLTEVKKSILLPRSDPCAKMFYKIITDNRQDKDLIVIDPITARRPDKPWVDDYDCVVWACWAAEHSGCSVLLVTHPNMKGDQAVDDNIENMNQLAGGQSIFRLVPNVLALNRENPNRDHCCINLETKERFTQRNVNRSLRILKHRDGMFSGHEIAMNFSRKTLNYSDLGVIER